MLLFLKSKIWMFFDETPLAYQTKKQSIAVEMVASVSPNLVNVVYY
jgi:hypothetical protein